MLSKIQFRTFITSSLIVLNLLALISAGIMITALVMQSRKLDNVINNDHLALETQTLITSITLASREMAHQLLASTDEERTAQAKHIETILKDLKDKQTKLQHDQTIAHEEREKIQNLLQRVESFQQDVKQILQQVALGNREAAFAIIDASEEREDDIAQLGIDISERAVASANEASAQIAQTVKLAGITELCMLMLTLGLSIVIMKMMRSRMGSLQVSVHEMQAGVNAYGGAFKEANKAVEQASAATMQISVSLEQFDRMIQHINEQVQQTATSTEHIRNLTNHITSGMMKLAEDSRSIGNVVGLIEGITDQINLLALNAAIEAARAGDAGRGFAVVADEVRKLANHTSTSTQKITDVTKALAKQVEELVAEQENIRNAVVEIDQKSEEVSSSATQQSSASRELTQAFRALQESFIEVSHQMEVANRQTATVEGACSHLHGQIAQA